MKLTDLHVKNYRSLVDVKLPLRDLTVIIGPNGAGKTALLEVFQMLQQGSQQQLRNFYETQLGFSAVLSRPEIATEPPHLGIELGIDVESTRSNAPMVYQLELSRRPTGYAIYCERLEWHFDRVDPEPFHYISVERDQLIYADPETGMLGRPEWDYDYLELALAQVPRLMREPEALRSLLASTRHYSFLDVGPRGVVRLPQSLTPGTRPGPNGENLYSALHNLRASFRDIYERIETLLDQGFPGFERLEFPAVQAGQIALGWYESCTKEPFYANQLSEGTLRFLWLITTLLAPPAPAFLLLDEPEVSLHPELLKMLAGLLQDASARSRILVATHSPDLIRWLDPSEVLVAEKEEGVTRFTWADELDLDEWLKAYTLRELWLMGNLGGRP